MDIPLVRQLLDAVDAERLRADLFHLSADPLPFRKLNHTLPGHEKSTLHEADDFIRERLESLDYAVEEEAVRVQCFRCDETKPKAHQYSSPEPEDPWYTAYNIQVRKRGRVAPDETVVLLAHKDSQSWVDSPGALDNAVGTVAVLELARLLADVDLGRTLWSLFCNEEHTPWTSVTAAQGARERGENLVAVLNLDSLAGRSQSDIDAGRQTACTVYTCPEGLALAECVARTNEKYGLGLDHSIHERERPGDDDGSFVNACFPAAVIILGSWPYADPNYHTENDKPEHVDIDTLRRSVQLALGTVLELMA